MSEQLSEKTTFQMIEEEQRRAQVEAIKQIEKILNDNGLMVIVEQVVRVVPKK